MSTGALLYAFDSEIKYTEIAKFCAKQIKQHLQLPVTLISDKTVESEYIDQTIIIESQKIINHKFWHDRKKSLPWYNSSRSNSYDLTPYDKTLVLDVDYVVNSDCLKQLLDIDGNFFAHRSVMDATKKTVTEQTFGTKNTTMWWATVLVFTKTQVSKDIFEVWKMVQQNYAYYAGFFGFSTKPFRNDYALSIALLIVNGGNNTDRFNIPWPLMNVEPTCEVEKVNQKLQISYTRVIDNKENLKKIIIDQDIHVMGKTYLESIYEI